jgi:hypothetical protein
MSRPPDRSQNSQRLRGLVLAGIAAAVLPAAAAAMVLWLWPAGCDMRGDPLTFNWICLLPGLVIPGTSPLALLLAGASALRPAAAWRSPGHGLALVVVTGAVAHIAFIGMYLAVLAGPNAGHGLDDVVYLPQPFCAGALVGGVFWLARRAADRRGGVRVTSGDRD